MRTPNKSHRVRRRLTNISQRLGKPSQSLITLQNQATKNGAVKLTPVDIKKEIAAARGRPKKESTGESLLRLAKAGEKVGGNAPADLSSRIDDYLYGEE